MKNDPTSYNAMARVYRTAVAVSALILSSSFAYAADPPVPRGNVSVNLNPTTGYYVTNNTTLRLPDGVRATPSAGASTVTKYSGGLKQSIPTGITIDAIKKSAPLPVTVRAKTPALKNAAKGLFRANLAGLVLGAGLQQLLNGIDALIDDAGRVRRVASSSASELENTPSNYDSVREMPIGGFWHPEYNQASIDAHLARTDILNIQNLTSGNSVAWLYCPKVFQDRPLSGWSAANYKCYYSTGAPEIPVQHEPVPLYELDDAVDNSYVPEPSDWQNLTPHLHPDDIEITSAPTLQGEPVTTTIYDADGNPHKVRQTNIWYDFDIRDNPSPQPKLDVKKREETKDFEGGVLTGTTTTESTDFAGSDDTPPPPEFPIDCDLFPTACAWFEWTQEEPVEPDDDLSPLLQEVPIVSETYTITGGIAACPAPLVLDLSVFGSREVSYQPLCDLASTMKFLYLALMSFAAAVLLNRSINRV